MKRVKNRFGLNKACAALKTCIQTSMYRKLRVKCRHFWHSTTGETRALVLIARFARWRCARFIYLKKEK